MAFRSRELLWRRRIEGPRETAARVAGGVVVDLKSTAPDRSDILNIGGFSDAVFRVVAAFLTEEIAGRSGRRANLSFSGLPWGRVWSAAG